MVHAPHRPFACLLCDHAATKMEALAAHVKKHLFIYVCYMCEGKFVSSQGMTAHLKESHAEQDQDQAFTRCINNSYYLMQPGENIWGNEEREDARKRIKECNTELKGGDDVRGEEDGTLKLESGVENGGTKSLSQEMEQHGVSPETQVTVVPADECSNASTTSKTAVSLGVSNISSAPLTEEQTQQKEKVTEHDGQTPSIFELQISYQVYETSQYFYEWSNSFFDILKLLADNRHHCSA